MKRLCFIIPFWRRPEITELCFSALSKQAAKYKFDVLTCGDNKVLAERFGFKFFEFGNDPLNEKLNFLISKTKKYKSVVLLGSDDFISDETIENYLKADISIPVMCGIKGVYFHRITDKKTTYYQNEAQTVGAGRMFTKPLLDALEYNLWRKTANKGLDWICKQTVIGAGFEELEIEGVVIDVKHGENITSHAVVDAGKLVELPFKIQGLEDLKPIELPKKRIDNYIQIKVITPFCGMEIGTIKQVPRLVAENLSNRNLCQII